MKSHGNDEQRQVKEEKENVVNQRLDKVESRIEQLRKELRLYGIEVPD